MSEKRTFSKDELKMPEESFGRAKAPTAVVHHSHFGILLGLFILLLTLILIGLYLWMNVLQKQTSVVIPIVSTSTRPTDAQNQEPESNNAKADTQALNTLSTSNEIDAIDADLKSTNLDTLDADLPTVKSELELEP